MQKAYDNPNSDVKALKPYDDRNRTAWVKTEAVQLTFSRKNYLLSCRIWQQNQKTKQSWKFYVPTTTGLNARISHFVNMIKTHKTFLSYPT